VSGSGRGLSDEAISLARVLVSLLPDEPEATGLLALLLYCEARHVARRELLIYAPSIGGHAAMPTLFISRETHGPHRKSWPEFATEDGFFPPIVLCRFG
jgi:hypothetical protein